MKSKLNVTEFRNRLKDNTKIGSPKLKIPIGFFATFIHNRKCFYGDFDDSTFRLTTNSNSPTFYFLKGTYKKRGENLFINYSVEPAGKLRIAYQKYFPFVAMIMVNSVLYFEVKAPIKIYIIFNVFLICISVFSRLNIKWENRNLKKKFNKTFEVIE